ncbi:MAG: acylphosphatase [Ruminococcus sp.]
MEKFENIFTFSGRVQGVGFPLPLFYIAQDMGVTGWVRNLWDDRVEMEVQGTREEIREMVERLSQQNYVEIEGIESKEIPLEKESSFRIR